MGRWRLEPAAIRGVLAAVEGDLETMNAAWSASRLSTVMSEMDAVGPAGADVASALAAVLDAQAERLTSMGNRVSAGLVGVESALACFEVANEDMLAACQTQMLATAGSGDFSWWYGSEVPEGAV
ncbi:MAG TPA: DUF6507 family protein [Actinotalea caeni]|uniref:DUF6507 family protein n=1 Tax=Actinotalea caeni TaxID=1348467 RepID=UPI0012E2DA58|nr:DUF6507 family protein [Actinotalea caeni]HLV53971.1 DUF6507 family protein [Actinotalea caeni]